MTWGVSVINNSGVAGEHVLRQLICHLVLILGTVFMLGPIVLIVMSSSHDTSTLQLHGLQWVPGNHTLQNYGSLFAFEAGFSGSATVSSMLVNSFIVATGVGLVTTIVSWCAASVLVFFKWRWAGALFWLTFVTLLFPLESRFVNTFPIVVQLGLINTHAGMILPVLPMALATLFFRQYFKSMPVELQEAAMLDGTGPVKFLRDFVLPLSIARASAVFVVAFVIGWNQYLWPTMISTDDSMYTLIRGVRFVGQESGPGMAFAFITMLPPLVLVLLLQKHIFRAFSLFD